MPPILVSTWPFAQQGNASAWPLLAEGGDPLDAVLEACRVVEEDPNVDTVGFGGLPDAGGTVTLDGCVMRSPRECGSVCALRRHMHPARVARLVMERTAHVMLAGEAADAFATAQGEPERALLAPAAREAWEAWIRARAARSTPGGIAGGAAGGTAQRSPRGAHGGHDTIGSLAMSTDGRIAGACSTSGMHFKVPGRVGDSPIIGHGLYVDPEAGAATATGTGELIMGVCGSFLAVEYLRQGASAAEAARRVVERIRRTFTLTAHDQAAFIVLATDGSWGSAALRPGFQVACHDERGGRVADAHFVLLPE